MSAAGDGSPRLVVQVPGRSHEGGVLRQAAFLRGQRVVVLATPGDTVEIDARFNDLTVSESDGGVLLVDANGDVILIRGSAGGPLSLTVSFLDGPMSIEDLVAGALQQIQTAAGEAAPGGPGAAGPGLGGLGSFGGSQLLVDPLGGLGATGLLQFDGNGGTGPGGGDRLRGLLASYTPVSETPGLSASRSFLAREDLPDGPVSIPILVTPGGSNEIAWVVVSGIPAGVSLATGSAAVVPVTGTVKLSQSEAAGLRLVGLPSDSDADVTLTVVPFSQEAGAAPIAGAARDHVITVEDVADTPSLSASAASGNEDSAIALSISFFLFDANGAETLSIRISGVPTRASLSAGTANGDGSWTFAPTQISGLSITPPANSDADFTRVVTETSSEGVGGSTASRSVTFPVSFAGVVDAPNL